MKDRLCLLCLVVAPEVLAGEQLGLSAHLKAEKRVVLLSF